MAQTTVEASCQSFFSDLMLAFPDVEKVVLSDGPSGHLVFVLENPQNAAVAAAGSSDSCTEFAQMATVTTQQLSKLSLGACQCITAVYENYAILQEVEAGLVVTVVVSRVGDASPLGVVKGHLAAMVGTPAFKEIRTAVRKVIETY